MTFTLRALALAVVGFACSEAWAQPCTMTVNATPNAVQTICEGASVQLNSNVSNGNAPYTYSWTPIAGLSDPAIANPVASPTINTVYTLTVTDDDGCTATDQVTINVNAAPPAALTSTGPEQITTFNGLTTFSICDPSGSWNFSFTDQTAGGTSRTINWGDGSPTVNPAQDGALATPTTRACGR